MKAMKPGVRKLPPAIEREKMPETPIEGPAVTGTSRPPSLKASLVMAVIGVIVATGATMMVLQGERATGTEALLGALALAGFGIAAYGLIQAVLATIDTAGERRRQEREVSERRQGARARPTPPGK
jgi:hypothetical protein